MGNEASLQMEMATNFDAEEIKRLGKRFKKLDLDNSGSLSVDEFMTLPELQQNPLVQRVIDIFDEDGNGEVDFKEFIQGVSQFSVKGDKSSKLKFAFRYCYHYRIVLTTSVFIYLLSNYLVFRKFSVKLHDGNFLLVRHI